MEIKEIRCIVRGRVQGVFFRAFIAKRARHLALVGYVKNLPDFTVEIVAEGYRDQLEELLAHAHKGPFLARVSDIAVEWRSSTGRFQSFEVVF